MERPRLGVLVALQIRVGEILGFLGVIRTCEGSIIVIMYDFTHSHGMRRRPARPEFEHDDTTYGRHRK